jgi:RNA polymerase sporulation-specific sigma factor
MTETKINAADHLGLVGFIANKYRSTGIENDELFSAGSLGLVKAANSFDSSRGFKFATYAARCINNEILMFLRQSKNARSCVSLHQYNDDEERDYDFEIAYFENYNAVDDLLALKAVIGRLDEREKKLIYLRFFCDMKQSEVGKIIGVEQSYISRLERRALKKLKEYMTR